MNMIAAQPSIATAPRDAGALATMGRYQLIRLADQLGLTPTAERRTALKSAPINEFVTSLLLALQEYDAKNPQAAAPAAASPAPVEPEAPPANPAPVPAPKKEPRTRAQVAAATAAAAATSATPVPQAAVQVSAIPEEFIRAMSGLRGEVQDVVEANKKLEKRMASLEEKIEYLTVLGQWQFTLLGMVAQQHLEASAEELLTEVVRDREHMLVMLAKASESVAAEANRKLGKGA